MLLSVCMKDYVARSYGHTPRKLPLKSVPLRATSRFIAYQAEIIILYLLQFVKKNFSIYDKKYIKIFTKFQPCFCPFSPNCCAVFSLQKAKTFMQKGFSRYLSRVYPLPLPHLAHQITCNSPSNRVSNISSCTPIYNKGRLPHPKSHREFTVTTSFSP
jgi:hypothetical protein